MTAPFDLDDYLALRRCSSVASSPDGGWLAVELQRWERDKGRFVSDLWRVEIAGDAPPHRLTRGSWNDRAPTFRGDGALCFLSDRPLERDAEDPPTEKSDGDAESGRSQVWCLAAEGGEAQPLTDEPLGVSSFAVARRDDRLLCLAPVLPGVPEDEQRSEDADRKKRGPSALRYRSMPVRFWDHWLPAAQLHLVSWTEPLGGRVDLTPEASGEYRHSSIALAEGGQLAVLVAEKPGPDRAPDDYLEVFDLVGGARWRLGEGELVSYAAPKLTPKGDRIAVQFNERSVEAAGPRQLMIFETAEGSGGQLVTGDWDAWPSPVAWSEDGGRVFCTVEERGDTVLYAVTRSGARTRITPAGLGGTHSGVQSGPPSHLVGLRHSLFAPPEPFVTATDEGSEPHVLGCLSGFEEAQGRAMATMERRVAKNPDGTPVESFLLRPVDVPDGELPLLTWIHGGPIASWGNVWHWRWNSLMAVSRGYATLLPNPRGSTGYGQAFVEGIWGDEWGAACFEDVMAAVEDAASADGIDGGRAAAMGGSFGGYMTNWIGGHTGDRFRCLITHASVYDFRSFGPITDLPAWFELMLGKPFERGVETRYSPHLAVKDWKAPTLVIHGDKDYRVPVGEGLALFERLQSVGVPSEMLVFPDENHWIQKPENIRAWYEAVFEFLGRYLG